MKTRETKSKKYPTLDVYFDVDGTLIDLDDRLRPYIEDCWLLLNVKGYNIHVWSGGGVDYAAHHARRIVKENPSLVDIKINIVPKDILRVKQDKRTFVVDDVEEFVKVVCKFGGGYKIPFFYWRDNDDDEMFQAYKSITDYHRRINSE